MRPMTTVMYDLARIYDETGGSPVTEDNASGLIRELVGMPDEEYTRSLETLRTLGRVYNIADRLVPR